MPSVNCPSNAASLDIPAAGPSITTNSNSFRNSSSKRSQFNPVPDPWLTSPVTPLGTCQRLTAIRAESDLIEAFLGKEGRIHVSSLAPCSAPCSMSTTATCSAVCCARVLATWSQNAYHIDVPFHRAENNLSGGAIAISKEHPANQAQNLLACEILRIPLIDCPIEPPCRRRRFLRR